MNSAMAGGVSKTRWWMEDIASRIEARNAKPAKLGPYKSREAISN
jgi:hypothetical protein